LSRVVIESVLVEWIDLAIALSAGDQNIQSLVIVEYRPVANFIRSPVTALTDILII
jgi:hypothetical protein